MTYVIFYKKSDGEIFSYVSYSFEYASGGLLLNKPTKEKCATNNNISVATIGIKKWTKENPQEVDFVDNINNFASGEDLVEL